MKKSEKESIDKLRQKVNNNSKKDTSLYIGRVPRKEREWFVETANQEFEGDFGMLLKWLCQGYMPPSETENRLIIEDILNKLDKIEQRLNALEQTKNVPTEQEITTLNGRKIKTRMKG
ncbi:MAG: hypothetical protein ACTSX6_14715 [Candidatus Heimdallarchaeaceae archaeon]